MANPKKKPGGPRAVAVNRRARHDYEILQTWECGIVLKGSEVKSLRDAQVQLRDAYARVEDGELWLFGVHIAPYLQASTWTAHDPDRKRKLLAHNREIHEMAVQTEQRGLTLIPLQVYFKEGKAKVEIGLARGRHTYDKRAAIAQRDAARELERQTRGRLRGE